MPTPPDQTPHIDTSLIATISGWVTALAGFLWSGGKTAQKFEAIEQKMEKLEDVHEILATVRNDIGWIKDRLR